MDRARAAVDALERLVGGLGTAVLALGTLVWVLGVAAASLVGVGLPFVHSAARAVRASAGRERARLSRWGPEIIEPEPLLPGLRAVRDPAVWRELAWVAVHGTWGMVLGILGVTLPLYAVQDTTFPLWYRVVPPGEGPGIVFWQVYGLSGALLVALYGLFWLAVCLLAHPALARAQAWPGRRLLAPPAGTDLSLRVAQLTATRAAALDAHAAELRRIERSLHDGAQNRLVAVTVLLGAARRQLARDPAGAGELLERAQSAAEQALAELRGVVKTILPPVLDGRGLDGALKALTADCAVPCKLEVDLPHRCAASVEATAYFVVAEALTNITKHSRATSAKVTVTLGTRHTGAVSEAGPHRGGTNTQGDDDRGRRDKAKADDSSEARRNEADARGGGGARRNEAGVGGGGGGVRRDEAGVGGGGSGARRGDSAANSGGGPPGRGAGANGVASDGSGSLLIVVEDDGQGGADESHGSGITGIRRRVEAYDGSLSLTSPAGGPTTMRVELPCGS
ncbi:hypothetical protein Ade02nite_25270 [Paractinoplanes deccanensis]|uniref:histidine kinase n=1 Tax=Paractinoplanes deccanensis TaxID=113561 RepID=A0ABQ3Y1M6_9ACTN|nr:sensor histidine kinase [Actinoplanes deccanensis]GID73886.1 hypothetical protein Ade02nite_25270 [Actinoplanes deccanensis]